MEEEHYCDKCGKYTVPLWRLECITKGHSHFHLCRKCVWIMVRRPDMVD